MKKISSVLITGGFIGFIGNHLVDFFARNGCFVRVLDNFSSGRIENIELKALNIEILREDLKNFVNNSMNSVRQYLTKIWGTNWKYLIILDACRYDYFEKVYRNYLDQGILERVFSPAGGTLEWLTLTFKGNYRDIIRDY